MNNISDAKIKNKCYISGFINKSALNKKVKALVAKAELKTEHDKLVKLQALKVSGKSHFEDKATQNYLVFHQFYRFFKEIINTDDISVWKSKGLSDKSIKSPATSDNCLALLLNHINTKIRVMFHESCLKQDKTTFAYTKVVNIYFF